MGKIYPFKNVYFLLPLSIHVVCSDFLSSVNFSVRMISIRNQALDLILSICSRQVQSYRKTSATYFYDRLYTPIYRRMVRFVQFPKKKNERLLKDLAYPLSFPLCDFYNFSVSSHPQKWSTDLRGGIKKF